MSANVKVGGVWKDVIEVWVKKGGVWREITEGWGNQNGTWNQWWPEGGESGPGGGTYRLSPTALYLPSSAAAGYAEFNTTAYRGSITAVSLIASYKEFVPDGLPAKIAVSGRPNGNFYRDIVMDSSYANRTITHGISSHDASAVSDFNSGAAYGFTLTTTAVSASIWRYVQLQLTTA